MPTLTQISNSASQREVVVNENFESIEHQAVYSKRHPVTTGLVWGFYGGRWGGFAVTAGTFTLTASTASHVVVARATGVTTCAIATTNWNDAVNYARVYKLVTSSVAVTAVEDHRSGPNGVHGGGGSSASPAMVFNRRTASYTLLLADGDGNTQVEMNVASANTLTIPPNASAAIQIGRTVLFSQYGAGQTTVAAGSGVTLRYGSSLAMRARYSTTGATKVGADEWYVFGDMA